MIKILMFFFVLAMSAQADDLVEFRSASKGEYRYADWSHSFSNKLVTDLYYVGVPGANWSRARSVKNNLEKKKLRGI
jgi:hypothetical protein